MGLVSAITFPWTLKFLWAPVLDRVGTRRAWIAGCLAGIAALTLVLGATANASPGRLFWLAAVVLVTLSATQDIAIDAFTIESTATRELGVANSVRIGAYRLAMFAGGGVLLALAELTAWRSAIGAMALVTLGLAWLAMRVPVLPRGTTGEEPLWAPVQALLARPGIGWVALFALCFKLGDYAMEPMTRPFWVDRGLSLVTIGGPLTTARLVGTLLGAVLGGVLTTRLGIVRALWMLGALQALSNLGYWAAAAHGGGPTALFAVAVLENLCGGLGTAAFVAFLMSVCDRRFAATQYAVLSALLALGRSAAGSVSGVLAERLGYAPYFLFTFALALPAFALLPLVRGAGREDGTAT